MDDLPNELLDRIARHLPMRSLQALACLNKRLGGAVAVERQRIALKQQTLHQDIQRFSWTSGLSAFLSLLGHVRRLRPLDQAELLLALCMRMDRLREAERKQAAAAVLKDPTGLSECQDYRWKILADHGSAANAVVAGEPLDAIVRCFGISATSDLEVLAVTHGPIQASIDAGEDRDTVARRHGFRRDRLPPTSSSLTSNFLQGVSDPSLYMSRLIQARCAVRQGEHVDTAMNRCFEGVDFCIRHRAFLVQSAADGIAGETAAFGENVDVIARRHGIDTDVGRMRLERHAYNGVVREEVLSGQCSDAVAERHGIRSEAYRLALMCDGIKAIRGDDVRSSRKTVEAGRCSD